MTRFDDDSLHLLGGCDSGEIPKCLNSLSQFQSWRTESVELVIGINGRWWSDGGGTEEDTGGVTDPKDVALLKK